MISSPYFDRADASCVLQLQCARHTRTGLWAGWIAAYHSYYVVQLAAYESAEIQQLENIALGAQPP